MPFVVIEVISPTQHIQDVLEKATTLVKAGVKSAWTVEPYGRTIFVTTKDGNNIIHDSVVEAEGIKIDFSKIFRQTDEAI